MITSIQEKIRQWWGYLGENFFSLSYSLDTLHITAFYIFLFSIPFQKRLIFITDNTFLGGGFVEYNSMPVYLSDLLLIITLLLYFVKFIYKANISASYAVGSFTHLLNSIGSIFSYLKEIQYRRIIVVIITKITGNVNVSRETFYNRTKSPLFWLLLLVFWSFLSIIWSLQKDIALFKSFKMLEMYFLVVYIYYNYNSLQKFISILFILIFDALAQSVIGILQFIIQHSIGIKFLGEPIINVTTPGVAKLAVDSERLIRSYGTFPHPNVFAGFLVMTITITIIYILIHSFISKYKIASREAIFISNDLCYRFFMLILFIQITAIILTFSRSGWLGLFILLLLTACLLVRYGYLKIKWNIYYLLTVLGVLLIISNNAILSRLDLTLISNDGSFSERVFYNELSFKVIEDHFIAGVGIGNFVSTLKYISQVQLSYWQYQPVHNIYLLILSELGIIGLIAFIIIIGVIIKTLFAKFTELKSRDACNIDNVKLLHVKQFYNLYMLSLFILVFCIVSILIIGLFDHYFWTLQQGQLTFWITVSLYLVALNNIDNYQSLKNNQ